MASKSICLMSIILLGFAYTAKAQVLPSFMLDHTGFHLPEDNPMANAKNRPQKLYPAFPLSKSTRKKSGNVIGYIIPAEYLNSNIVNEYKRQTSDDGSFRHSFRMHVPNAAEQAMAQLRKAGLYTYYIDGNVYGLREKKRIRRQGRSSGFGISLSLDFSNDTLDLTDYSYDCSYNPLAIVNNLFQDLDNLFNGPSAAERIGRSMHEANVLGSYIYHNTQNDFHNFIPVNDPAYAYLREGIPAGYRREVLIPEDLQSIEMHSHARNRNLESDYSREVNSLMSKIKKRKILKKEEEWKSVVSMAADTTIVLKDPTANLIVQSLCDVIAETLEVPKAIWPKCRVAATLVPNAWAYPGGDIFISAGMIGITDSLDSIAYVLAHEVGHVIGRHTSKKMPLAQAYQIGFTGLSYYLNYTMTTELLGSMGNVDLLNFFPKTMWASAKSVAYSIPVGHAMGTLVKTSLIPLMAYGRSMESQADRVGQQVAMSLGFDNDLFVKGWKDMKEYSNKYFNDGSKPGFWAKALSTHPSTSSRIEDLEKDEEEVLSRFGGAELGKFPSLFYDDYMTLHKMLKPYTVSYGNYMKDKISKNKSNLLPQEESLLVDNFMQSFYQGSFGCLLQ